MTTLIRRSQTLSRDALAVLQPGFGGTTLPDWVRRNIARGQASVALFGRNIADPDQVSKLTAAMREENEDILVAIDEEGGDVTRLEVGQGSSWPGNLALGAVDDVQLTEDVAREMGRSLAACGINYDWAPSADVNSNPNNPVIGVRAFGADEQLCSRHTSAWVTGLQSVGVAACAKHFPGHGDTAVDSHVGSPRLDVEESVLRERDLAPFRAAIGAGVKAIMTAHILVPALDRQFPATVSPRVLTDLLRGPTAQGGLGFDGLIVTDGIEMGAIARTYGTERGTVMAIAAGADAVCTGGDSQSEEFVIALHNALVQAVIDGDLPEERLAEAAGRVRALGAWTRRSEAPAPAERQVGLAAARRAIKITYGEGARRNPTQPLYVATLTPKANIAAGEQTPWGVSTELQRLCPTTETGSFSGPDAGASALAAAGSRRLVVVVRDAHRHPWMARGLDTIVAARPDTIVVEMGVPQSRPVGSMYIATHGAARVCGVAAAEAITRM